MQGSLDADRLASLHVPVTQLQTSVGFGGECHLDANMVRSALPSIPLDEIDLLVIENVGNLVCPAEFRVGEDARVMVASVTEGEDKPLKYPLMFRACELVVLNKIDLLPYVDFDVVALGRTACRPSIRAWRRCCVSARTGEGVVAVARLARRAARAPHGGGVTDGAHAREQRVLPARVGAAGGAVRRDGAALPARRAAARGRRGVRRAPRRGRVRPPGDRRQAGAAGAGDADARGAGAGVRVRRHRRHLQRARGAGGRGVVLPAHGRPVRSPGAGRDALPRALGARARVLGASRPLAGRARARRASSIRSWTAGRPTSRRCARTCSTRSRPRRSRSGRCASRRWPRTLACSPRPRAALGPRVLALGNGGSATDAMDVVADFRARGRRALDLTDDPAVLTAIANDIGVEAIFARQVIAHGRHGDTLLTLSTSGSSANVLAALDRGAPARAVDDRAGRLRRRADRFRGAGRLRRGRALGAHPADPGGAGERVPHAGGARRLRVRARVTGVVQGVGYRPFVFGLASSLRAGRVRAQRRRGRAGRGRGARRRASSSRGCASEAPPLARVESVSCEAVPEVGARGFEIRASPRNGRPDAPISPDVATCAACLSELFDPARPPLSLPVHQLHGLRPALHDRDRRAVRPPVDDDGGLRRCARSARREYDDPRDRRFHAQPNACPECGPRVTLVARRPPRSAPRGLAAARRGLAPPPTRCSPARSSRSRASAGSTSPAAPTTRPPSPGCAPASTARTGRSRSWSATWRARRRSST